MKAAVQTSRSHDSHLHPGEKKPFFGNRDGFFKPYPIQTKLTIGKPNDPYEREADAMADKVVQRLTVNEFSHAPEGPTSKPPVQLKCAHCEEEEKLQKKKENDESIEVQTDLQKPSTVSNADPTEAADTIQTKCNASEVQKLQAKSNSPSTISTQRESLLNFRKGRSPIQARLTIGKPNDPYEKEADAMADKVVQRIGSKEQSNSTQTIIAEAPPLQMKCSHCQEEENLQKKEEEEESDESQLELQRYSMFANGAEPIDDEEQNSSKRLMKKEGSHSAEGAMNNFAHQLDNEKGKGSSLDTKQKSGMESAFGTSFKQVRIHTDDRAVQMNRALNAQAFTHGNDIYFNRGKYDTGSKTGQHLLAHELTHTIQQRHSKAPVHKKNDKNISRKPADVQAIFGLLAPVAAPVVFWGGRYILWKVAKWGIDEIVETDEALLPLGYTIRQTILKIPIDLKGQSTFQPNAIVADHIQTFGIMAEWIKEHKQTFPIFAEKFKEDLESGPELNIKFGDMSRRDRVRIRWDALTKTYEMSPYFMDFTHPAFDPTERKIFPYLAIGIDKKDSSIYGAIAAMPANFGNIHATNRPSMELLIDKNSINQLIFGNEFLERPFNEAAYVNEIVGGNLTLSLSGYYDTGGNQQLIGAFVLHNEVHSWSADVKVKVPGLTETAIPIERDNRSQLTGNLPDLKLDATWNFNNLTASISASYINNTLEIRGTATYIAKPDDTTARIQNAEVTLLVTTESKAWEEVKQQLPQEAAENVESHQDLAAVGETGEKLVLVGWGSIGLVLFRNEEGKPVVTGSAGVVLDPEGHLTVSGTVRVEEKYELMEPRGIGWTSALYKEYSGGIGFPAGAKFTGEFCLLYKYIIGPVTLYDIVVNGIYSTNPKINKELSIGARLNLSAELSGKAAACGRLAARVGTSFPYLGFDVAAGTISISGTASLKSYLDMAPTIGMREATKEGKKGMQYFVKGTIDLAGQLSLTVTGELVAELLYKDVKSVSYSNTWPLASAGLTIDFDYTLGQKLDEEGLRKMAKFRKSDFNGNRFISGVLKDKKNKSESKLKGGFKDEASKKLTEATSEATEIPHKEISPQTVSDEFNMQGKWHALKIDVASPGQDTDIYMASNSPKLLSEKIKEHRKNITLTRSTITDKAQLSRIDTMLSDLDALRDNATRVVLRAKKMGVDPAKGDKTFIPGFRELANQLQEFGKRYNVNDIGFDIYINPPPPGTKDIPEGLGDGTYEHPIKVRWSKRGYHENIVLKPNVQRFTETISTKEVHANYKGKTRLEIPSTQLKPRTRENFPGTTKETINGVERHFVEIGVNPSNIVGKGTMLKRVKSSKKRVMSGRFRTLLANYNYDLSGADADHVLDLGWGGKDVLDNLWPIYSQMNTRFANSSYYTNVSYFENGVTKENQPYFLIDKWFLIDSVGD